MTRSGGSAGLRGSLVFHNSVLIDAEFECILYDLSHLPTISEILDPPMASATAGIRRPPALPADIAYTSHYCEENIYLLAQAFYDQLSVREAWDIFVVFISNHTKTVCGVLQPCLTWEVAFIPYIIMLGCSEESETWERWCCGLGLPRHPGRPA